MLPRDLRLTRPDDYARVKREGRNFASRLLVLGVAPNAVGHNRYGIVVTRRLGGAVERNRAKRVVRACLRALHDTLQPGYDITIICRQGIVSQSAPALIPDLARLLKQAGLVKDTAS
jgi:ribonuclease P protein component